MEVTSHLNVSVEGRVSAVSCMLGLGLFRKFSPFFFFFFNSGAVSGSGSGASRGRQLCRSPAWGSLKANLVLMSAFFWSSLRR